MTMALVEKGLWEDAERVLVDIRKNANFAPEYMQINPRGVVPTVVLNGQVYWDSPRIIRALDAAVPAPELAPARAEAWTRRLEQFPTMHLSYRIWTKGLKGERSAEILDDKVSRAADFAIRHPELASHYQRKQAFFRGFRAELTDPRHVQRTEDDARATLDALAAHLQEREWVGGRDFLWADCLATATLFRMRDLDLLAEWASDAKHPLTRYLSRALDRPSVHIAITEDPMLAILDGERR